MSEPVTPTPEQQLLAAVKAALNIGGTYQDAALQQYIDEVKAFLLGAGVAPEKMTPGLITRGVADLWAYGAGDGTLSDYFMKRAIQAALHS
jgi:hypothetical protein